jgi:sugar O-acyltransferase (sialic acid O-acetyltransferase NeuD family)
MRRLLLLGFGGHARSVADVALSVGYERLLFVDEHGASGESFGGFPVVREMPATGEGWPCIPCAGRNDWRREQLRRLVSEGRPIASVISPRATVGAGAEVGAATFVGHHAHIGPLARIGAACIVNTGAAIEHDCVVGECCHVSVNSTVAGRCVLGDLVFVGAGATVVDRVSIASEVTIGAGAVVIANIDAPGTYVGVPARMLR